VRRTGGKRRAFERLCEAQSQGSQTQDKGVVLRDLIVFTDADPANPHSWTITDHYLYCQPVDVWVGLVSDSLNDLDRELQLEGVQTLASQYDLDDPDTMVKACRMIKLALEADVSPLKVNQGVWFFAAQVAADEQRLRTLLSARSAEALEEELQLMRGFLPSDTFSGPLGEVLLQARMVPQVDQQALAKLLTAEASDERKWQRSFAASRDRLGELADEALGEYRSGQTQVLDPDKL